MKFTPVASMDQVLKIALMPIRQKRADHSGPTTKAPKKTPPPPALFPTDAVAESEHELPPPTTPEPARDTPAL